MNKYRFQTIIILLISLSLGWFLYSTEKDQNSEYRMKYGLDLSGGTHLVYQADVSTLKTSEEINGAMSALKTVIERRVNLFGVSEPLVQTEHSSIGDGSERLVVELPGVTDIKQAVEQIGKTPLLEFKLVDDTVMASYEKTAKKYTELLLEREALSGTSSSPISQKITKDNAKHVLLEQKIQSIQKELKAIEEKAFISTGLTGRLLKSAQAGFDQGQQTNAFNNQPIIFIEFNSEGAELFEKITTDNIGKKLAIFLDGSILSSPLINEPIQGGKAQITGQFTLESAKTLARDLNYGALPVPIELVSTQSIGASLGETARTQGVNAGLIGLSLVALFLILWYRLPGLIASLALGVYLLIMLSLFKVIPIVLTSAGIAGFILSFGMAVDANVLVFERMKEEFRKGNKTLHASIQEGFARAWSSIRDGNTTTLISALVLYLAGTPLTKGFAVTLSLGVIVSIFSSMVVSRAFLHTITPEKPSRIIKKLFGSGIHW